ncbi:MAG: hypothetical protein JNL96_25935 [Planctomycetaceae bacterium]|nr:hypothetical protein [Planctomycetaceae bacterium]
MISIPRSILSTFRSLVRKAGLHKRSAGYTPGVTLVADGEGCRIRCASPQVAIQYHHPGSFVAGIYRLPLEALDAIEGKDRDTITIEGDGKHRTLVSWTDRGVPRQTAFDAPKPTTFPDAPTDFTSNEPALWSALRDAVPVTDRESTRYALGCLHLRGGLGRIDAADGRHVLTQAGFRFPWSDDVLLPANGILGCRALDLNQSIEVGRASDWIGFRIGPWLVMLAMQKEGRYPKIDDVIPKPEAAKSRLELSAEDARFLGDVLPRLPCDDPHYEPITLDLNGQVLLRTREAERARPTQVELAGSRLDGEAITFNSNRKYLAHALRLGFRTLHCYGSKSPVLCADDRRRFLWCLLDAESAIPRHDDPICITPPAETCRPVNRIKSAMADQQSPFPSEAPAPVTTTNPQVAASATAATPHDAKPVKRVRTRPMVSTIEQAIALRDALRGVAQQAGELAKSLKQQKRQARIVASTLASLKELQKVAG